MPLLGGLRGEAGHAPRAMQDLDPSGVAELEGLVVEAHGAVRRQAREVHPRVGQSGLPARGARSSAAGQLGEEEGAQAASGLDRQVSPAWPVLWYVLLCFWFSAGLMPPKAALPSEPMVGAVY